MAKSLTGIKTNLLKLYRSKLRYHKNNVPETSRGYKKKEENLRDRIEKIKLGSYTPLKSDIINLPKTPATIKYIKSYDTDNESYHIWNNAIQTHWKDLGDLSVYVHLNLVDGGYLVRVYHVDSDRLNGKVSDSDVHDEISKKLEKKGGGYIGLTQSGYSFTIVSYTIIKSYRQKIK
jgi:hypothetical protein